MRKTKKSTAFWATYAALLGMFTLTALLVPLALPAIASGCIAGIVSAAALFQGANVADNWQRSVNYRPELDKEGKEQ